MVRGDDLHMDLCFAAVVASTAISLLKKGRRKRRDSWTRGGATFSGGSAWMILGAAQADAEVINI